MTPKSFHTQSSSPPDVSVAMRFPTLEAMPDNLSATASGDSPEAEMAAIMIRANGISSTLKQIQGYSHGGINE
jgi:hypothetical protein